MRLTVCYKDKKFLEEVKELLELHPLVELEAFDETHYKEKKKAFRVKGGYSAKQTPFMLLSDVDKNLVRAFYSEAGQCTIDNLRETLNSFVAYSENKLLSDGN